MSIIDEVVKEVSEPYALRDDDPYEPLSRERRDDPPWPFADMQVGECFDEFNPLLWDRVRACASMHGYKHRKKFATRVLHHKDWDDNSALYSVRVWRLE
jgi:hypothetical protein